MRKKSKKMLVVTKCSKCGRVAIFSQVKEGEYRCNICGYTVVKK